MGNYPFASLLISHFEIHSQTEIDIYKLGAIVEALILAIDIFDDIQDEDNQTAPWQKVDVSNRITIALTLQSIAMYLFTDIELHSAVKAKIYEKIHYYLLQSIQGQHADLLGKITKVDDYLLMIERKSGSLTALVCEIGLLVAGEQENVDIVKSYGEKIGMLAQIINDLDDFFDIQNKNDLAFLKPTLPVIFLKEKLNKESVEVLDFICNRNIKKLSSLEQKDFIDCLIKTGVKQFVMSHYNIIYYKTIEEIKLINYPSHIESEIINLIK